MNMKKILFFALGAVAALTITSCSDEAYTEKYNDPSKATTVTCDKLFTGVVWTGRTYGMQTYWGLCTFELPQIGSYSQIASHFVFDEGTDYAGTGSYVSYGNDRWMNFYETLAQYKLMRYTFQSLSSEEQSANQLYMDCASVWMYDQIEKAIDLWGDIPFTNACNIQISGTLADSRPSYDDAQTLYEMMLNGGTLTDVKGEAQAYDGLAVIYNRIKSASAPSGFAGQDILFQGDVSKWASYAIGLRARMALRVSTQGALEATGKSVLSEIANSVASEAQDCATGFADPSVVAFSYNDGNGMNWGGGWNEWSRQFSRLTYKMAEVLNLPEGSKMDHDANIHVAGADPRAAVMFDASANGTVHIMDYHDTFTEMYYNKWRTEDTYRYFTVVDSATFINNAYFMHPIMTKAEMLLTLAEAAQRGIISGNAESYFKEGVQASIDFYYAENAKSVYRAAVSQPDATAYIDGLWDKASDKLEAICNQRWLHFSFLQPEQTYSEVRRTGFPKLEFRDFSSDPSYEIPLPMDRIVYASDETTYNLDNKNAAISRLSNPSKEWNNALFWAKSAGTWYTVIDLPYE